MADSFIWGLVRNWRYNRNKKKLLRNIDIENDNAKGIVRYQPSPIESFFNGQVYPSKIVVSGGVVEFRAGAILGAGIAAYNQSIPAVVLHAGNRRLETIFDQEFAGGNYVRINSNNPIYDPLIGLSNAEINKLFMSSAANGCEIKSAGKYYLDGVTDFIKSKGVNPYLDMYMNAPHMQLFDKIDQAEAQGRISANAAQDIKSKIVQGQIERNNIEYFFDTLKQQGGGGGGVFATKQNISNAESIKKVAERGGTVLIDILSSANSQLVNLIASEISIFLSTGQRLLLVIDSISVEASEALSKILKTNFQNCGFMLVSEDAYSALGGNDSLFSSFVGSASKYVVFNHTSAISAGKWSQAIGDYDKHEVSKNYLNTANYNSAFSIIPGQTQGDNLNVSLKRENRVKPEEIMRMRSNEAYIYDAQNQEFAYCEIT